MQNIKLIIAYEGTAYAGWQKVGNTPTIEGELQKVLEQLLQHPIKLQAASRTDAGVHAEGQVANFFTSRAWDWERLQKSCNALLPPMIRVLAIEVMHPSFHPTLDVHSKEYHYHVCLGPIQTPFERHFSWHFVKPVDLDLMGQAAECLTGKHDFTALANQKQDNGEEKEERTMVREVYRIEIELIKPQQLQFRVAGNHFLYKMVRNMVGTLLYVGCGMLPLSGIKQLLERKDRTAAGMTAPAHGLILKKVNYD